MQIVVVGSQSSGKSSGMLFDVSPAMRTSMLLMALRSYSPGEHRWQKLPPKVGTVELRSSWQAFN